MSNQDHRIPGAHHPITITQNTKRVTVTLGGHTIADTTKALLLREADYPAVQYIPRDDIDMAYLTGSDHITHCPYKGDASYFNARIGEHHANVAWSYEHPYDAVAAIRGHLAFYPDRVDGIQEGDEPAGA
jgi:uncharacterized protein (DUF427 family)